MPGQVLRLWRCAHPPDRGQLLHWQRRPVISRNHGQRL